MEKENAKVSPRLLEAAIAASRKLVERKEIIDKFQFGRSTGFFWIASEPNLLKGPVDIEVDGKTFYLGMFRA